MKILCGECNNFIVFLEALLFLYTMKKNYFRFTFAAVLTLMTEISRLDNSTGLFLLLFHSL